MDDTHFAPGKECNRIQVVTFLYRAKGSPAVGSTANPFVDVPNGEWFTTPVLWALENGVTEGVDPTHFAPSAICNRAQVVTFLYRAYNK